MRRRAELVDDTRLRITEAAVRLHTSVGPSATSMAAVAAEAGVTRLTLSRHFPSREALFAACMGHWSASHPPPNADTWRAVTPFRARVKVAVDELYAWYEATGADLYPIYRDEAFTPESTVRARRANIERMVDAVVAGSGVRGSARRRLRAAAGHAFGFWTWHSLRVNEGLDPADARSVAANFVIGEAGHGGTQRRQRHLALGL